MMHLWKWIAVAVSMFILPLVFQNCGGAVEDPPEDLSSILSNAPFGFQFEPDLIAFMPKKGDIGVPFFTFRSNATDAYKPTGLSLTQNFIAAMDGQTADDKIKALTDGTNNKGTSLYLGLRHSGALLSGLTVGSGLTPLSTYLVANAALTDGPTGYVGSSALVTNLNSPISSDSILNYLLGDYYLASIYTNGSGQGTKYPDGANPNRNVFGYGYKLSFKAAPYLTVNNPGYPQQPLVSSITEYNLESSKPSATWACYHALIIRGGTSDVNTTLCNANAAWATSINDPAGNRKTIFSSALNNNEWTFFPAGTSPYCVYPKTNAHPYKTSIPAYPNGTQQKSCNGGDHTCPQYVSVCIKP